MLEGYRRDELTSSRRGFARLENMVYSVPTINIESAIYYISGSGLFNTQIKCRLRNTYPCLLCVTTSSSVPGLVDVLETTCRLF